MGSVVFDDVLVIARRWDLAIDRFCPSVEPIVSSQAFEEPRKIIGGVHREYPRHVLVGSHDYHRAFFAIHASVFEYVRSAG